MAPRAWLWGGADDFAEFVNFLQTAPLEHRSLTIGLVLDPSNEADHETFDGFAPLDDPGFYSRFPGTREIVQKGVQISPKGDKSRVQLQVLIPRDPLLFTKSDLPHHGSQLREARFGVGGLETITVNFLRESRLSFKVRLRSDVSPSATRDDGLEIEVYPHQIAGVGCAGQLPAYLPAEARTYVERVYEACKV